MPWGYTSKKKIMVAVWLLYLCFPIFASLDQEINLKRAKNVNMKRIYDKQRMLRALFYLREVKLYMDNVRASVTNSMSVSKFCFYYRRHVKGIVSDSTVDTPSSWYIWTWCCLLPIHSYLPSSCLPCTCCLCGVIAKMTIAKLLR